MKLDGDAVRLLLAAELKLLLRDRRTVLVSLLLPLLVMPVLLFAGRVMEERRARRLQDTRFTYALSGPWAGQAHPWLAAAQGEKPGSPRLLLEEVTIPDPTAALADSSLDLWVQALAPGEAASPGGTPPAFGDSSEAAPPNTPVLLLIYRADRDRSAEAMQRLRQALEMVRQKERFQLLADAGLPLPAEEVVAVEEQDVASAEQVTGLTVGRLLTVFFLLFILSGGAVVATDTLAGEKERGTLETLLTTGAGQRALIAAKLLTILAVAAAITVIQAVNFLAYVVLRLVPLPSQFTLELSPATAVAVLVLWLPVAALVSALLLLTSGFATSHKEAQLYFFPTLVLTVVPALAPFLPGVELRSVFALLPIAGIAVGVKEILIGAADVPMLVLTWLVNGAAAVATAWAAERTLSNERLIMATAAPPPPPPSPQLFERQVLRAFAVLWAVFFIVSLYGEGKLDPRLQGAVTSLGVFLAGTLLLLRRYRLCARQALAWRPVGWPVWLAVVIGAPAGLLTGIAVFRVANQVLPVPPTMLEAFSEALLPEGVPFWHAVLFLAILPGICEELAFRGLLLYGLHRRLHPMALVVVVGAVFGLFHLALFRIIPTAYLGALLTGVTLLTGSVLPAMVWHTLHNALALGAVYLAAPLQEVPPTLSALAAAALATAAWVLWRARTPYPNLRRFAGRGRPHSASPASG